MKEKKDVIYPLRIDPETYEKLKEYAKKHGRQSIRSVISYAVTLFLQRTNKNDKVI